mgnify:CR=1 FL=1
MYLTRKKHNLNKEVYNTKAKIKKYQKNNQHNNILVGGNLDQKFIQLRSQISTTSINLEENYTNFSTNKKMIEKKIYQWSKAPAQGIIKDYTLALNYPLAIHYHKLINDILELAEYGRDDLANNEIKHLREAKYTYADCVEKIIGNEGEVSSDELSHNVEEDLVVSANNLAKFYFERPHKNEVFLINFIKFF